MRFLRKADYYSQIKQDNLNVIIEDQNGVPDQTFLIDIETAAISEVQSYLRQRYNVVLIFGGIEKWDNLKTYIVDDIIYYEDNNLTYKALDAHSGKDPVLNPTNWEQISDPRDSQLKLYSIDIALYHIHSRINPRNVPEVRLQRRDEAVKWLGMISKSDVSVNLPEKDEEQSGYRIKFGSKPQRDNNY